MNRLAASLTIIFLLFAFSIHAQQEQKEENHAGGIIRGGIIDSASGQAIEYAAVSLLRQEDRKVMNGATADVNGIFKLEHVAEGTYILILDFIGYQKKEKKNIIVSKENSDVPLGNISLASKEKILKEVTVTSDKNVIENKIDKMVYNVDKDVTSQGGAASDVLKKVPQVSVDVEGNVELQGNSNIRFLINGKPSVLFGSNIADVLQSIPSSQIQSIEIITSPGAKYDAEGTGGIINILLKKSTTQGVNGNVSVSAGTRLENGSFNLNARKEKLGVHAFLSSNAQLTSTTLNRMNRVSQDSASTSQLLQNGAAEFNKRGYQCGIGFDWDLTKKDNLNASVGYNYFGMNNKGGAGRESVLEDAWGNALSEVRDTLLASNKFHDRALEASLGYRKKFKKEDQELEILCNTSQGKAFSHYVQTQKNIFSETVFNSTYGNNPGINNQTEFLVNYTHPVTEETVIETGVKAEFDHVYSENELFQLNLSSGNYEYQSARFSGLEYNRGVYAGYFSIGFRWFKWLDMKAGTRSEYTNANAAFSGTKINFAPYNTLAPSLILSHKFKKEQTIKLSYTHRIQRPAYEDLNPFINASDPKNIVTGNPHLLPEIGDKMELSYSQPIAKKGNITGTLFFRGNTDDIQWYTRFYTLYKEGDSTYSNVSIRTRENIGHENNYGLNVFVSVPVSEKINIRSNISGFQRYIYTGISSTGDVHGFNYRANLNATYQLSGTLLIEAFGNFNSPRVNAQGTMPSFTTYNLAFRKQLFHKNGSVALTATNFFNEYVNQETKLTGDNFALENLRRLPYRSFGINFTYKFGKLEFKKEKETEDINLTNPPGS